MTTFVSRSGRVLAAVTVGVFGLAVGTTLFPFTADGFIRSVAVFGFLSTAIYAAFWRPRLDINDTGMAPRMLQRFKEDVLDVPSGVVLVTGPTGSGKTTTLYGAINYLNSINTSIITAE
ncbi:MAG: ATPase, T2SS/T4P/T4SS family, partial [Microbacteriaceae bacterium]